MRKFFLALAVLSMTALFVGCLPAEDEAEGETPAEEEAVVEPEAEATDEAAAEEAPAEEVPAEEAVE